jgi:hypothetical protein
MAVPKGLREFIESLNSHGVEYLVVGAHALAFHGRPRYTGDIDLLLRPALENADAARSRGRFKDGLKQSRADLQINVRRLALCLVLLGELSTDGHAAIA